MYIDNASRETRRCLEDNHEYVIVERNPLPPLITLKIFSLLVL